MGTHNPELSKNPQFYRIAEWLFLGLILALGFLRRQSHNGIGAELQVGPHSTLAVLNRSALRLLTTFAGEAAGGQIPAELRERWGDQWVEAALRQMIALGLLVQEGQIALSPSTEDATLIAWMHITNRCNLRCSYCYLPHGRTDMSVETGRAAIAATIRSALAHSYGAIKLKYAGGEAMLRFPVVADLHAYAQAQASSSGLALDGVVLSNGTLLTTEVAHTMRALGLRLMLSLDGLGAAHNGQRAYGDGRESAAAAVSAIDLALAYDLALSVSVTVSSRNVSALPRLVTWLLERGLRFRLHFYRENERSASIADLHLEQERIIAGMLETYRAVEAQLPRHSVLTSLVDLANLAAPHVRTCGVGHNYLVFDEQGQVAKCQMQICRSITSVTSADPLMLIRADREGVQNLSVEAKAGCQTCEWRYWCAGGCPLTTHRATARYDVKSPNCAIYKALYPEVMRLEGLEDDLPGVKSVVASYRKGQMTVEYDETRLSEAQILAAVARLGYTATA
ncbi:MAG: SPASM domain-containing protein [Oscillochloris sp.]|nr:SPASM domain-containing protein [Oscillochloris sp.]